MQSDGVCPKDTWYGLDLESLKGVCATLEEFGYNVYDAVTLSTLINELGSPMTDNNVLPVYIDEEPVGSIIGESITSTVSHTTQSQSVPSTQISSAQPIDHINQLQQQIGALQQQLNQLQQSLIQSTKNLLGSIPATNAQERKSQSLNHIPTNSQTTSPIVVKATLESQFTETSSNPITTHNNHIISPHSTNHQQPDFNNRQATVANRSPQIFQNTFKNVVQETDRRQFQTTNKMSPFPVHHQISNPTTHLQNVHIQHNTQPNNGNSFIASNQNPTSQNSHTTIFRRRPQVHVEPLDFVHFQQQPNSIEHFGVFEQQFPNSGMRSQHSTPMSAFQNERSDFIHQDQLQGSSFIPNFSIETQFNGGFVPL